MVKKEEKILQKETKKNKAVYDDLVFHDQDKTNHSLSLTHKLNTDAEGRIDIPEANVIFTNEGIHPNEGEYILTEGGFSIITDSNHIEYARQRRSVDVIQNTLLGLYDKYGRYSFTSNIRTELIHIVKIVDHYIGNVSYCSSFASFLGAGSLSFAVQMRPEGENLILAELFLLEPILKAAGFVEDTIITKVDEIKVERTADYVVKVYDYWNIRSSIGLGTAEDVKYLSGFIARRKIYLKYLRQAGYLRFNQAEATFLEFRFSILSRMGKFGQIILEAYNQKLNMIQRMTGILDSRQLNEVLDFTLSEKRGKELTEYRENEKEFVKHFGKEKQKIAEACREKAQSSADAVLQNHDLINQTPSKKASTFGSSEKEENPYVKENEFKERKTEKTKQTGQKDPHQEKQGYAQAQKPQYERSFDAEQSNSGHTTAPQTTNPQSTVPPDRTSGMKNKTDAKRGPSN